MPVIIYVRVGVLGQVGRFASADGGTWSRGCRVICRTARGLEVGEVLGVQLQDKGLSTADGSVLRALTPADDLLLERLERNRQQAFAACVERLAAARFGGHAD